MADRGEKKSKRRRRDKDDDDTGAVRGSGVNYAKVSDRHVDDNRYEKLRQAPPTATAAGPPGAASTSQTPAAAQPQKVSAQMAAVMRLMSGQEERTIAQKLADSNRPTWEQYKKDNEDKLQIEGLDQKKMEAYRKELDEQREKWLTRGLNHKKDKDDKDEKKSKKKKKRKHKSRRHDDSYSSDSDRSDDDSTDSGRKHKRKKHRKKSDRKHDRKKSSRRYDSDSYDSDDDRRRSSKHSKKKKDKKKKSSDDGSNSGDSYRLSSFFTKGSDDESK